MTKKTVTQYNTVEEEVTRFECDHCQALVSEEDVNTRRLYPGDASDQLLDEAEVDHICEECQPVQARVEVQGRLEELERRWSTFAEAVNSYGLFYSWVFGLCSGVLATQLTFYGEVVSSPPETGAMMFTGAMVSIVMLAALILLTDYL